uniref:Mastigoneme protein n=1 Tax=Ochromonas danica TaxID=2986 RepID=C8KGJ1_OCHDN|nr:mastigoneme protein [Ochromonas danica]|eukprot:gene9607-10620_t
MPTSMPTYIIEPWGQDIWDKKRRIRSGGLCDNSCSGHGICTLNNNCKCYVGSDGEDDWTGPDCSLRTCPKDYAWVGEVIGANDLHPRVECSNKGICNRQTGMCECFLGYDGIACQRSMCPENCNYRGACFPERILADKAGRKYEVPWDAMKAVGCLCDVGYRGPACDEQECPSGPDPLDGFGNEAGRDCSGRGVCNYDSGLCTCFSGFFGNRCQHQTVLI